ncbi:MAG: beta-lactamase family protein, partial [Pseudomonadota bacterium]|nr:beta-lactamase family protein [Pseudomonadota bacterium]
TKTPGLAILEIRDGEPQPEIVRGRRANDGPDPVQPGDSWHIGSNSKPITTTLIAVLVDRRRLRWESRLGDIFPELAATMHPAYRDVTVEDLASHRSGLAGEVGTELLQRYQNDSRPLPLQRHEFLRTILAQTPTQPRGTYAYSSRGFVVLGAIAEQVGGRPVEALLRTLVFEPLEMDTAAFGPTPRGQPLGHERGAPVEGARQDNPALFTTAGTMRMSLPDWARWAVDQMEGERGRGRLMSAASYRRLHTPLFQIPGRTSSVGLGWGIRQESFGRFLTHTGSNGLWYAAIGLAPDIRSGILIATNSAEDMGGDVATDPAWELAKQRWRNGSPRAGGNGEPR